MDVSLLEEQYDHIKQKQKLQSHIIVFKTGMLGFIGNNVTEDVSVQYCKQYLNWKLQNSWMFVL